MTPKIDPKAEFEARMNEWLGKCYETGEVNVPTCADIAQWTLRDTIVQDLVSAAGQATLRYYEKDKMALDDWMNALMAALSAYQAAIGGEK